MEQLQTRLDALERQLQTFKDQTHTVTRQLRWWRGVAGGLLVLVLLTWALPTGTAQEDIAAQGEKEKKSLEQRVAALESLLKHFSRQGTEVTITGANLHLVNGLGRTDCGTEEGPIADCPNGLGNLIVGYNEPRPVFDDPGSEDPNIRTGSHNVVVGREHNFSRFGGIVVGISNEISGEFAAVSGGGGNTASGTRSSVSGGQVNMASGGFSSASGGVGNIASGFNSTVCGGAGNTASGGQAAVSGGVGNMASGDYAVVSGGAGQHGQWAPACEVMRNHIREP